MIQQRQRDIEYRETANDTRQRLMSDMSRLETKMERLSDQLSIKEREMQAMASKEQKLTTSFKTQLEKLQLEKDELQRMLIATQQVRSQQNHELKKKEKEYVKLQERLNQVAMEKKKESKNGLEIMNLLQKEGRQRGTWNAKKADGDFYKMIVDAYETKKQDLVAENADLRALLRSMQADMRDFLNTSNGSSRPGNMTNGSVDLESPLTPLGGRTDVFDLPFHMARDQIEQSLRAKMSSIKERMMQLQEGQKEGQDGDSCAHELQLEEQFAEACSILDEQATFMTEDLPDPEENSDNLKEPQLREEIKAFTREENTAGREQKANIAASKDFGRERNELAKAQQKLAEEQASWTSAVTTMAPALRGHSGQGGLCDPPRFENYEEFEHWIARSAFGGRHDETMVMLQRTQTVAIGPAVSDNESRFTEIA
jgi:X breakpoint 2-interacting protein